VLSLQSVGPAQIGGNTEVAAFAAARLNFLSRILPDRMILADVIPLRKNRCHPLDGTLEAIVQSFLYGQLNGQLYGQLVRALFATLRGQLFSFNFRQL
jgi:hypothetical protein